jgi:hypothetical protein
MFRHDSVFPAEYSVGVLGLLAFLFAFGGMVAFF